ncbi:MAG: PA14 domain-containing protein, partial [Prosthecobacter sp.]|nr:PA14 domain-containing protein [Prosthecobacter sp.]
MTLIMVIAQPATSLRAAFFLWAPNNAGVSSLNEGGTWSSSFQAWHEMTSGPNTLPALSPDTDKAWNTTDLGGSFSEHTAVIGFGGVGPSSIFLSGAIEVGSLVFGASNVILNGNSNTDTLTFSAANPTITIKGSSMGGTDTVATINARLMGSNGLRVIFDDSAGGAGTKRGVLRLGTAGSAFSSSLTGGIEVANQATLEVRVASTDLSAGRNPLGANQITLEAGSAFTITGVNSTNQGLSGRVFNTNGTGNSGRVNFGGTADAVQVNGHLNSGINNGLNNLNTVPAAKAVQWVGKVQIAEGGAYTFFASADDGARVFIDGVMVINNDGGKGNTDLSSEPIFLAAGLHDIRIDYVNGSAGGNINLAYAGPSTHNIRTVIPSTALTQAEFNTLNGSSNALQLLNDMHVTGNAVINLAGTQFTSAQMGKLELDTGRILTVDSIYTDGRLVAGNSAGFGKTLRFGGTALAPTIFGTPGSVIDGMVTIASDANVAFDGVVSDEDRDMVIRKTGAGWLSFNQTSSENLLGAGTQ